MSVPTVLAEAMACGLPVVSITVAGIPESLTQDDNGLLATPHDVEAIAGALAAAALTALLADPHRRRLGAAARRTLAEGFDLGAKVRRIAAFFKRALAPWA